MPTLKDIASYKEKIEVKAKELGIKSVQLSEDRDLDDKYYLFLITTGLETSPELKKTISSFKNFLVKHFEDDGIEVDDTAVLREIANLHPEKEFYKRRLKKIIDIPDDQSFRLQKTSQENSIKSDVDSIINHKTDHII